MKKFANFLWLLSAGYTLPVIAQPIASQIIWEYSTNGGIQVVAPFPDVNGDGRGEVLAGTSDHLAYCLSGGGPTEMREVWSCLAMGAINDVETIGDVNEDGYPDAVAGAMDNLVYCISGKPSDEGRELWTRPDSAYIWSVASLGDVDGDGLGDVVVGTANNNMICISGAAQEQGKVLWQFSSDADFWNVLALPDVNGDGKKDCAGSCDNFVYCCSGSGQGAHAKTIWSTPYDAGARIWALAAIPDVSDDGKVDILTASQMDHIDCVSGATGKNIWTFTTGADVYCVAAISDLNGDGKADVLAGSADDYAYALSGANGQLLWKVALNSTVLAVTALGDVNGDGLADAVFGSDADEIVCISGGGASKGQKLWTYMAKGGIISLAAIGDVNGNGMADVAAASTDSYLRVLEGNSTVLDVELVTFTATVLAQGVQLSWCTACESNNLGFEIHRSNDGHQYEQIGFVPGHGTSNQEHHYTFLDQAKDWQERYYRLVQIDHDGRAQVFTAIRVLRQSPSRLAIIGNYPNPFNAGTFINYELPETGWVKISISNLNGQSVRDLRQGMQSAGSHSIRWDGCLTSGVKAASGIYWCVVQTRDEIARWRISLVQ